jgi:serine/threonine protein kinase
MPVGDEPKRAGAGRARPVHESETAVRLIGNYLILDKLSHRGVGTVFKVRNRRLGRVEALKILPAADGRDRAAVTRLRRALESAGRLNHPNLVAIRHADEDRGVYYLVMDYVEGCDLERIVRDRGPMQVAQALECLIQAAHGLEAAHAKGIIHGNLKPGNIMLDQAGTVRVLGLGLAYFNDAGGPFGTSADGPLRQSRMEMGSIDYLAPEQAEDSHRFDHQADIYSLACTLYYLLTAKKPFVGENGQELRMARVKDAAPSLRIARPDVSPALDAAYLKMMAKRAEDRPPSMTEVIALLEACKASSAEAKAPALPVDSNLRLMVFNDVPLERAVPEPESRSSIFVRPREAQGTLIKGELSLEDLVMEVGSEPPLPPVSRPALARPERLRRMTATRFRGRSPRQVLVWVAGLVAAGMTVGGFLLTRSSDNQPKREVVKVATARPDQRVAAATRPPAEITAPIFDGMTGRGWMLCERNKPVPAGNIQRDGLNPHGTGSYLVVYDQMLSDFVLDFDYKLTERCNSGVFLRVSDLKKPVQTGIEVALDDSRHGDERDSGGFYGLVAPRVFAQKPAGEWNHMTITARGPRLTVVLNGTEVSTIDLDQWTTPGKRPDGSNHNFKNVAIASLARNGYLGFQDLGSNCWFRNILLTRPATPPLA